MLESSNILTGPMAEPIKAAPHNDDERFRLLVESVKDYAIFMLEPDGRIATWNAGAERLKGYRAEEIIGQHFSKFYSAEDLAARKPQIDLERAKLQLQQSELALKTQELGVITQVTAAGLAVRNSALQVEAARKSRNGPVRCTSSIACHCSSDILWMTPSCV